MADKRARELGAPDTEASISPDLLNCALRSDAKI